MSTTPESVIAFAGTDLVAEGSLAEVAAAAKQLVDSRDPRSLLIYDAVTSAPVEIDFRGSVDDVLARLPKSPAEATEAEVPEEAPRRGPGRPKLGVVAREVTLLPRHWEWLAAQPGGASVTLRKLVETARRENAEADRSRQAKDAVYRFASALAGNAPGYEEAMRALYADDRSGFVQRTQQWPPAVRDHARALAETAFGEQDR